MNGDKRNQILQAFINVCSEKGYHNVRISDITDCANIGKGTFYLYFTSKNDCLMHASDLVAKELKKVIGNLNIQSLKDIHNAADKMYDITWKNRHMGRLLAYELLEKDPEQNKSFTNSNTDSYKELIRTVRPQDSEEVLNTKALIIMGIMDALSFEVFHAYSNDNEISKQHFIKAFKAIVSTEM